MGKFLEEERTIKLHLEKQHKVSMNLLPVIVTMVILGVVGIVGNSLTVVFYIRRAKVTASVSLIICLALVDLAVCLMIIPSILEMTSSLTYYQGFMCKLSHFSARWTIASSCIIIWIISIDRYRKICKPFSKQITLVMVKRAMYATAVCAFLLSVKNFVTFDSTARTINDSSKNQTLTGYYCTTRKDEPYRQIVLVTYGVDVCFILLVLGTLIFTYSNIIYTLVKLGKKGKRQMLNSKLSENILNTNLRKLFPRISSDISGITRNLTEISLVNYATSRDIDSKRLSDIKDKCTNDANNGACKSKSTIQDIGHETKQFTKSCYMKMTKENNITMMMFVVSIVYIFCFAPYFVVRITLGHGVDNYEFEMNLGIQVLLRLIYLNSVFNPIIYCVFNRKFRRFIKRILACTDRTTMQM